MFKRLIALANKPKKPIPIRMLLAALGALAVFQVVILTVVTVWPERAFALSPFMLLSLGLTSTLWLDLREAGVEQTPTTPSQ